jgi:deazaflavin-dependent oxidoreductase (nitroreductase family)
MKDVIVENLPSHAATSNPAVGFPYPGNIVRSLLRLPIWLYRAGLGSIVNLMHIMVLTTEGRKSGLPRHTAIEYRTHGSKIYVVSAWGDRPDWYRNLSVNPVVSLRRGTRQLSARAHVVNDASEALRVLNLFRKTAPAVYDAVLTRLSTEEAVSRKNLHDVSDQFTIVRFDPIEGRLLLPTVTTDLRWVWLVLISLFAMVFVVTKTKQR